MFLHNVRSDFLCVWCASTVGKIFWWWLKKYSSLNEDFFLLNVKFFNLKFTCYYHAFFITLWLRHLVASQHAMYLPYQFSGINWFYIVIPFGMYVSFFIYAWSHLILHTFVFNVPFWLVILFYKGLLSRPLYPATLSWWA